MIIQMKATEQYFHVVLFIVLCKVVLTFKSVDKTLAYDHSNESYRAAHSGQTQKSKATSGFNRLELRKSLKRKPARLR